MRTFRHHIYLDKTFLLIKHTAVVEIEFIIMIIMGYIECRIVSCFFDSQRHTRTQNAYL